MKRPEIVAENMTQQRLKELLHYDPDTGIFTWRISPKYDIAAGAIAGHRRKDGYLIIRLSQVNYYAHRLAWLYMTGEWPPIEVDHLMGDKADNRWTQIRSATPSLNKENMRTARKDNRTGLLGAHKAKDKFSSRISIKGVSKYLGTFDTPEEAHAAYCDMKRRHHQGCTI